jgi:hypothetical protein
MFPYATLVFREDSFIAQDPRVITWGVRFYRNDKGAGSSMARPFERYTLVTLSTQPDSHGYVGVAVYSCCVDRRTNVGWLVPDSEPPLSEAQAKIVREWLLRHDPLAWEHMAPDIRYLLGETSSDSAIDAARARSLAVQVADAWVAAP